MFRVNLETDPALCRYETFEGRRHLVAPVVMIVEGVLNNALLLAEELEKSAAAWNGRPVPVLHPTEAEEYITANRPDIIEKNVVGHIFNAKVEDSKLKAEIWIDEAKAKKLGHSEYIASIASGKVSEVSTGYFADEEPIEGDYNGKAYVVIHRNLRPDHLALLPNETGACSVEDGAGTPRVNKQLTLTNEVSMTFEELHANGKITAKQLTTLQDMAEELGPEQLQKLVEAVLSLLEDMPAPEAAEEPEPVEEEEKPIDMVEVVDIQAMIAQALPSLMEATSRRLDVEAKLKANERNNLSVETMRQLPVETLEQIESSLRPVDYSGQVFTNGMQAQKVEPLLPPSSKVRS